MFHRTHYTNADAIPVAELTPAHAVNERLAGETVSRLSPSKKQRIVKALGDTLVTYPLATNTYRVITVKDDGSRSDYVVSVYDRPWCECGDFIYSCLSESNKLEWCKHILRVWAEVRVGALPPLGVDPAYWLRAKLKDEFLYYYDVDEDIANRIRVIHDRLEEESFEPVLFRRAMMLYRDVNQYARA